MSSDGRLMSSDAAMPRGKKEKSGDFVGPTLPYLRYVLYVCRK